MSDTTPSVEETPSAEQPGAAGQDGSAAKPAEAPADEAKGDGLESLPESWQREIRSLRAENADRRTKFNELKEQLDQAKSQEDIDKAVAEYKARAEQLERELSIEKHTRGLPEGAAELVTGNTDEEIKASADKVRKLLEGAGKQGPEPDLDATGGTDPRNTGGKATAGTDPRALARASLARR